MNLITRIIHQQIKTQLFKGKIMLIIGPRQIGKTTLLKEIITEQKENSLWLNTDEGDIKIQLQQANTSTQLKQLFGNATLIIIDEAQQIENIGLKLKLVIDTFPDLQIIATGSSAFELSQKSNEPLTGRKNEFMLYPISFAEMVKHSSLLQEKRLMETRLLYGCYPEVLKNPGNEKQVLQNIVNSYLYKDVLQFEGIKKSSVIEKLIVALALQIGNEVSYNELAKTIGNINAATVEKYIDVLEKAFIVFKLNALSRNVRNEIKKGKKIYFYDTGVRNRIINNFNPLELRNDKGALWENYLMAERKKRNSYTN
jgi:predicted AAA+ superfamily ATPase